VFSISFHYSTYLSFIISMYFPQEVRLFFRAFFLLE
jgi:hypothetical protein